MDLDRRERFSAEWLAPQVSRSIRLGLGTSRV
jgi:hypothetical protein